MDADRCWIWNDDRQISVGPFETEGDADLWLAANPLKTYYLMSGPLHSYPIEYVRAKEIPSRWSRKRAA